MEQTHVEELERALNEKERELCCHYYEVAKALLAIAECKGDQIDRLVDEIIELRRQVALARGEQPCPRCTRFNEADSHYCRHCGQKIE